MIASGTRGDLDSTVKLLTDLAQGELLSPALFAFSVHNAPAGALSLCLSPNGDHTALAGDAAPSRRRSPKPPRALRQAKPKA
ncbi:MAG: beta-ketoacyl synthase chain length factor [Terricaulis sp.]|nr:beta-ketoacyl synthase chain length factor [Terricaulis sp.]